MTGFGRTTATRPDGTVVSILVRSVNHRFLDVSLKLRDELAAVEGSLRRLLAERIARGHVDVTVRVTRPTGSRATFDVAAAAHYSEEWRKAAVDRGLPSDLSARDLLALPGVLRVEEAADVDDGLATFVREALETALADHAASREREGVALLAALEEITSKLEGHVSRLEAERQGLVERIQAALEQRLAKLLAGAGSVVVEEGRLAQEVALLADKADVTEELQRLRAHLVEVRRLLSSSGASGKRLDFLTQELLREANTTGSKLREAGAAAAVLDLKSDIEAFKEQVQNVE